MGPRDVLFFPRKEEMPVPALDASLRLQSVIFGAEGRKLLQALTIAAGPVRGQAQLADIRIIRNASPMQGELIVVDAKWMLTGQGPTTRRSPVTLSLCLGPRFIVGT
jgi:polysaccharide biosynthesis/export protein